LLSSAWWQAQRLSGRWQTRLLSAWWQAQLPVTVLLPLYSPAARDDTLGLLRAARHGQLLQLQLGAVRCVAGGGGIHARRVARGVVVARQVEYGDLDGSRLQGSRLRPQVKVGLE
jgi:hypothetical protein